jgi:hypothetical protein
VVIHGNTANFSVSYSNNGTTTVSVNVYAVLYYPNGTVLSDGYLLYTQIPTVAPGDNFSALSGTPPLSPPGAYSVTFYVINNLSQDQISSETTTHFTITA